MIHVSHFRKNGTRVLFSLLYFLCFLLSFLAILGQSLQAFNYDLWVDEAFSLHLVEHSAYDVVRLTAIDVHPPLYYLILQAGKTILHLFVPQLSPIACAKLISVLPFLILWLVALFWVPKRWNKVTAANFVLLVIGAPQLISYGVDVRMYGWGLLFVTCAYLSALTLRDTTRSPAPWISFVLFSLTAAYTHYFCLVAVGIAYLLLLMDAFLFHRERIKPILLCSVITVLCYLPWLIVLLQQLATVKESYWISPITWSTLQEYWKFAFGNGYIFIIYLFVWILAFTLQRADRIALSWCVLCFAGTIFVGVVASLLIRPVFVSRYMVPTLGCLWLAYSIGVGGIQHKAGKIGLTILSVCLCLNSFSCFWRDEQNAKANAAMLMETLTAQGNNAIYIVDDPRARNVVSAMTSATCYAYTGGIDSLTSQVYKNLASLNDIEELKTLSQDHKIYAFVCGSADGSMLSALQENGWTTTEVGAYFVENTINRQQITLYSIS